MGRGYNHYPNCGCGWCSSTWGNVRVDRSQLRASMQTRDAERILREQRASNGYSSCFVNPNAVCPVCKATVFYYQNDWGSRVFFDDLGPPWPKHGCTDNPRLSVTISSGRPRPRARGMRLELAEAASFLGLYDGARYHRSGYAIDWQMIEIACVERKGFELFLTGHLIEMAETPLVYFSITCPDDIVAEGDVVSGCYSTISIFHPAKLEPRQYQAKWFEDEQFLKAISTGEHLLKPPQIRRPLTDTGDAGQMPAAVLIPRSKIRRQSSKTAPPKKRNPRNAKTRKSPQRPTPKQIEPKTGAAKNEEPKTKSANQLKREDMLSRLVIEYRGNRVSRSLRDEN